MYSMISLSIQTKIWGEIHLSASAEWIQQVELEGGKGYDLAMTNVRDSEQGGGKVRSRKHSTSP